ncbi:MAG: translation elongation factor Ts [Prevotella sp.]|uniref:translation elongation factor Ts n=1 Tax=Prevotella sp. P5-92 TaxID=2024222 RepID=UPI000B968BE9|nr:translation elongation factor Ts [Prevotella sp. P5-92]MCI7400684.1 translation elongation factor Ts [Prevotella sp.]MDD6819444.1 translation elongation factor Ts [Prevotella sp.]OYP55513.1 elongation factor Ts [Prevotella sp. P5-92]
MAYKPNMEDIKKLRTMTGAGLADVKKALTESEGDFNKAMEIIREKGQAIAAKRSDRETSNGCVLVKAVEGFAAIVALKCETDFVANGADYVKLTQDILDAAVAAKAKSLDEVKELTIADGTKVQDAVVARSGITGEKMELDGYNFIEGDNVEVYDHMGKHTLCTMVQTNKEAKEQGHAIAMQVAAMKPVALNQESVPQSVIDEEIRVAVEKTKQEQVQKAVEAALKKAGINPAHVDSEDHMESNMGKGWITAEQVAKAKEIIATVSAEKAANLPEAMIQNIAKGRLNKFFKESCLLNQEFIQDSKLSVADYLKAADKELTVVDFKRFTLAAE